MNGFKLGCSVAIRIFLVDPSGLGAFPGLSQLGKKRTPCFVMQCYKDDFSPCCGLGRLGETGEWTGAAPTLQMLRPREDPGCDGLNQTESTSSGCAP